MKDSETWTKEKLQETLHVELQSVIDLLNSNSSYPDMIESGLLQIIFSVSKYRIDKDIRYIQAGDHDEQYSPIL